MANASSVRRVLLVRPAAGARTIGLNQLTFTEPLDLEYVAAAVAGHRVRLADVLGGDDLAAALREFRPDVVGLTGYITSVDRVLEHCRTVKSFDPNILTVVGGIHATTCPEDFFDAAVDAVIAGAGLEAFRAVVDRLPSREDWDGIPGTHVRDAGGTFRSSGPAPVIRDPGTLPLPRRDLTAGSRGRYYYLYYEPVALVRSSLSCEHRCSFCVCHLDNGGCYAARSARSFVDELKTVAEPNVYIVDNDFLANPGWLREFCARSRAEGILKRYVCFGRADFIARNPEVMEELASAGLEGVIVGHEFLDDGRLDGSFKRASVAENVESTRVLRRCGIDTLASFIIPHDCTEDYFDRLTDYVLDNGIGQIVLQTVTPLPGTRLRAEWASRLLTVDRDLFDMSHVVVPYALEPRRVYRGMRSVYVRSILDFRRWSKLGLTSLKRLPGGNMARLLRGGRAYLKALESAATTE